MLSKDRCLKNPIFLTVSGYLGPFEILSIQLSKNQLFILKKIQYSFIFIMQKKKGLHQS